MVKKPDPKKHSDIRVPDKDIRTDKKEFKESLKKLVKKGKQPK